MNMETQLRDVAARIASKKKMTVREICQDLGLNRRQLMYRIEKLNLLLPEDHKIETIKGSMFEVPADTRQQLLRLCDEKTTRAFELSPMERQMTLLMMLFRNDECLILQDFINALEVSRSTVLTDLKELGAKLEKYGLRIGNTRAKGYFLDGPEEKIRQVMTIGLLRTVNLDPNHKALDVFFEQSALGLFDFYELVCKELAAGHGIRFVPDRMIEFIYLFMLLRARMANLEQSDLEPTGVCQQSKEMAFIRELLDFTGDALWMKEGDVQYLAAWILGISVGSVYDDTEDCLPVARLTGEILSAFEMLTGWKASDREVLFIRLYAHIRPAYYRLLYSIPIYNPLTEKVRQQYPQLFSLVERSCQAVVDACRQPMPDEEIAFLVMHFAAWWKEQSQVSDSTQKKALIVCLNGVGASMILKASLQKLFPQLSFLAIAQSVEEIDAYEPDIVFASRTLSRLPVTRAPVVSVEPIMNAQEKALVVQEVSRLLSLGPLVPSVDTIMSIVHRWCKGVNEFPLRQALEQLFAPSESHKNKALIPLRRIRTHVRASSWKEAIAKACEPLLEEELITTEYRDHTIATLELCGPYIVIAPHVALVHTDPVHGARKPGLALSVLEKPVPFGAADKDPIRYLFALSTGDLMITHFSDMEQLMEVIEHPDFESILDTHDPKQINGLVNGSKASLTASG